MELSDVHEWTPPPRELTLYMQQSIARKDIIVLIIGINPESPGSQKFQYSFGSVGVVVVEYRCCHVS